MCCISFENLGISEGLVRRLKEIGIVEPSPIQELVIGEILAEKSVLATSQTGSGKTLAYLLPLIELLLQERGLWACGCGDWCECGSEKESKSGYGCGRGQNKELKQEKQGVRLLILLPTRELALQVGELCKLLCKDTILKASTIYGGVEYVNQIEDLKPTPSIIIATPGRLIDLIKQGVIKLEELEYFVLDEVDQLLDLGFIESILYLSLLRAKNAVNCCFSATLNEDVSEMARRLASNIELISIDNQSLAVELIEQKGYFVERSMMEHLLLYLIKQEKPQHSIVFTRSRKMADKIATLLVEHSISAEALHSDRSQAAREHILKRFKDGDTKVVVATDILARGIDVDCVTHVFNYGLPQEAEQYVHRIGRTGRAGRKGKAITLCDIVDRDLLGVICKLMQQNIPMDTKHPFVTPALSLMQGGKGRGKAIKFKKR